MPELLQQAQQQLQDAREQLQESLSTLDERLEQRRQGLAQRLQEWRERRGSRSEWLPAGCLRGVAKGCEAEMLNALCLPE